jgi:hypothetical protein
MIKRLIAVGALVLANLASGNAQALLNQDYLKQALRAAFPPSAQCTIYLAGPGCSYQGKTAKLDARMDGYDLVLTLTYAALTNEAAELYQTTLFAFAAKYGFNRDVVESCFHDGIEKFKAGKVHGIIWHAEDSGRVVNQSFQLLCHEDQIGPNTQFGLRLGPSTSF